MPRVWTGRNVRFRRKQVGQFDEDGIARRIVAAIRARIDEGVWQPGERLPSTRSFAAEWGASRTTVTAAYD